MGQAVDQADTRLATQDSRDIDDTDAIHDELRNNFQTLENVSDLFRLSRLGAGDDDVFPSFLAPARFIEHTEGFADAGGVAKEDFEASAAMRSFLRLHLSEQLLGVGTTIECSSQRIGASGVLEARARPSSIPNGRVRQQEPRTDWVRSGTVLPHRV